MKNNIFIIDSSMTIFALKTLGFMNFSYSSEIQNIALMHREGVKG